MPLLLDQRAAQQAKRVQDNQQLADGAEVAADVDRLRKMRSVQQQQGQILAQQIADQRAAAEAELASIHAKVEVARAEAATFVLELDARGKVLAEREAELALHREAQELLEAKAIEATDSALKARQDAQDAHSAAVADREASVALLARSQAQQREAQVTLEAANGREASTVRAKADHEHHVAAQAAELDNRQAAQDAREEALNGREAKLQLERQKLASDQIILQNARLIALKKT
jgi:hypothetical protein